MARQEAASPRWLPTESSVALKRSLSGDATRLWAAVLLTLVTVGCKTIAPSNHRDWTPDQALLPYATTEGDQIIVHNVRNCNYLSQDEYLVDHYNKTVEPDAVRTVDFIVVPFPDVPSLAHTMLSFGMDDGTYLCVSVEIRKERGESYAVLKGGLRQYELMYVVGDERDLIRLRTNFRGDDVYLYRSLATPQQAQDLFVDMMRRINQLRDEPEFYDTLTNNCTTNIVAHVNKLSSNRVPYSYQLLLPGHSDRLAYDLGLLDASLGFEETKRRAKINDLALRSGDAADFSQQIRLR